MRLKQIAGVIALVLVSTAQAGVFLDSQDRKVRDTYEQRRAVTNELLTSIDNTYTAPGYGNFNQDGNYEQQKSYIGTDVMRVSHYVHAPANGSGATTYWMYGAYSLFEAEFTLDQPTVVTLTRKRHNEWANGASGSQLLGPGGQVVNFPSSPNPVVDINMTLAPGQWTYRTELNQLGGTSIPVRIGDDTQVTFVVPEPAILAAFPMLALLPPPAAVISAIIPIV